jgi:hypothetical protein
MAPPKKSEYATGIKCSKREPSVYPFQVTDLLEYEVCNKHSQNKILGEKIAKILHQNTDLSDEIAAEYQTPSEKLKKAPIMALVTRTISTYMLVKHSKTVKKNHQRKICLHGGNHFSKRRSESEGYNQQSESHNRYKRIKSKNDIQSENEDIEVKKEEKLETLLQTARAKVTAKADEVKALKKTLVRIQGQRR